MEASAPSRARTSPAGRAAQRRRARRRGRDGSDGAICVSLRRETLLGVVEGGVRGSLGGGGGVRGVFHRASEQRGRRRSRSRLGDDVRDARAALRRARAGDVVDIRGGGRGGGDGRAIVVVGFESDRSRIGVAADGAGGVALGGVTSTPARAHAASTRRIWSSARAEAMRRRGDARISARWRRARRRLRRHARARALHPRYSAWILVAARCSSAVAGGRRAPRSGSARDWAGRRTMRAPERRFTSFAPCVREEEGVVSGPHSRFEEGDEDFGCGARRRTAGQGDAGPAHT